MTDGTLMLNMRRWHPWIGCLLAATVSLAGCAPKTNVSATGNVPASYSHVYMSVREIWFNTSATAGPDDTTWNKFTLPTPVTVDLATAVGGTVTSIVTGLKLPIGLYAQVRLIPVDSSAALLSSASSLGALYNSEVDYTDSAGTLHRVPLELQNPDKGIGVATSVQVKGDTTAATTTTPTATDTSTGTTTPATFQLAINVDGATDLVPFTYSDAGGFLLNPHIEAYDQSVVGAIQGTLDIADPSAYVNIQVTAESLSADGTRHVAVNSAPVKSDGRFTLYPLSTTSSSPTRYDLVIHGPTIATIIVKSIPVNAGDPSSTTPVNIGTLTPRAATSFTVNLNTTNPLPAGALVGFYQTLPGSGEVPYLIEELPIDPFSRAFASDQAISTANIDHGTLASGSNVSITTDDPVEGASTYRVSGTAPLFADGALTTTVKAPSGSSSIATLVAVPTLAATSGAALNATTVTISQTTPKKYDKGELIISHDGAIVATAALDTILTGTATGNLAISGLPGGGSTAGVFNDGLYYLSVRTWKSSSPTTTLNREIYPTPLDLRTGTITSYSLNID